MGEASMVNQGANGLGKNLPILNFHFISGFVAAQLKMGLFLRINSCAVVFSIARKILLGVLGAVW